MEKKWGETLGAARMRIWHDMCAVPQLWQPEGAHQVRARVHRGPGTGTGRVCWQRGAVEGSEVGEGVLA
eukprot:7758-Chlamydomonas_euryale.AAC.1